VFWSRPAVFLPLTYISRNTISRRCVHDKALYKSTFTFTFTFTSWRNFNETCHKYSSCEWEQLKRFQGHGSKVSVIRVQMCVLWFIGVRLEIESSRVQRPIDHCYVPTLGKLLTPLSPSLIQCVRRHTREVILIGSNVGPSSVGLVHTWDPIELCWRVTYTIHTKWRPNRYRRMS